MEISSAEMLVVALAGIAASCAIAKAAGRGRGSALWGLIGPVGWVIAAIHSIEPADVEAPQRASGPSPRPVAEGGRVRVPCPQCGGLVGFVEGASEMDCPHCRRRVSAP